MVAQALSKKAGVEFSIADISGDDLMSQREALASQGVKVIHLKRHFHLKRHLSQTLSYQIIGVTTCITNHHHLHNLGDVLWKAPSKHNQLHERLLWRRTYPECFE